MQNAVDVKPFRIEESTFQEQVRRSVYRFISASDESSAELQTLPEKLGLPEQAVKVALEGLVGRFEIIIQDGKAACVEAL